MSKNKWITLTFSNSQTSLMPSEDWICHGISGVKHIERAYLSRLPHIANRLKRKFIFPKPFMLFIRYHNRKYQPSGEIDDKAEITDYYNIPTYKNPPFFFEKNGRVIPTDKNLSIKYYDGRSSIYKMDKTVDIIVLSLFWDAFLPSTYGVIKCSFPINHYLKSIANEILLKLGKKNIFLHLRRDDFIEKFATCTHPTYIYKFFKENKIYGDSLFIACPFYDTEDEVNYFTELRTMFNLLGIHNIFFEKDIDQLSNLQDNSKIFLVLNEIAKASKINIITEHLKLGSKIDYKLYV